MPTQSTQAGTASVALTLNRSNFLTPLAVSIGNVIETPAQAESMLIILGEHLAMWLAEVLDVLRTYNEEAIYPIVSILEPYMETSELDLRMPPISSRRVIINVTDRGRAKPDLYIE